MKRGVRLPLAGLTLLLALAGCGRGLWQYGERASWRHEAEVSCLKSGGVKIGSGVVQIQPIEGPGMCGADFPLKVSALGEGGQPMAYGDDIRPPAGIPNASPASMPRWPAGQPHYLPPPQAQPVAAPAGARMQWMTGPQGIEQAQPVEGAPAAAPSYAPPASGAGAPMSIRPPGVAEPDDIPDDAILAPETAPAMVQRPQAQPVTRGPYESPQPTYQQPAPRTVPALGPQRAPPAATTEAALTPPATLACPIVSALDRWVSEGVQPAALHWFGVPVVTIKQISAYSCREMVGTRTEHVSEHAFGNALDIAAFTLANGRTVTVQYGWHGSPEEQGFLHDVQLYACETFTTVLAPGYNAAHYNHIHVDLMRRASGRTPCRPNAVPGEVVAARVRAHYASKGSPAYTGSIPKKFNTIGDVLAGADGLDDDDDDVPAKAEPVKAAKPNKRLFDFGHWSLFGTSSMTGAGDPSPESRSGPVN
jgi:hypothetical protein